jgi:hypothetical protein
MAILYRGIHESKFKDVLSALTPKERGPFLKSAAWDIAEWDTSSWNASEANAVIEHQHAQAGLPTSGLSTTPNFARARFYALGRLQLGCGFVVAIDISKSAEFGVSYYVVNDIVRHPAAPEDNEVILVARDFGPLPEQLVCEVIKVCA